MEFFLKLACLIAFSVLAASLGLFISRGFARYMLDPETSVEVQGEAGGIVGGLGSVVLLMLLWKEQNPAIGNFALLGLLSLLFAFVVPAFNIAGIVVRSFINALCDISDSVFKR